MVWRKSQQLQTKSPKIAAEWLETLNHPMMLDFIGDSNIAKIARRLMSLYEQIGNWEEIPRKRDLMSPTQQKNIRTIPYMLGYYLKLGESEKAVTCFDDLSNSSDAQMSSILALCIGKAKDMGNEYITIYGMKKMIDIIAQGKSMDIDAVNVPALVRCTLQLQMKSLTLPAISAAKDFGKDSDANTTETTRSFLLSLELIKTVFDQAIKFLNTIEVAQDDLGGKIEQKFTNVDILWIASKAYYSALQATKMGYVKHTIYLTETALKFLDFEVNNSEAHHFEQDDERTRLSGICMVLLISSLWKKLVNKESAKLTNSNELESEYEDSEQLWDRIYQLSLTCQVTWKNLSAIDKTHSSEYLPKLLIYELDSCLHLKKWGLVKSIVVKILKATSAGEDKKHGNLLECTVDLLLSSSALPLPTLLENLHVITSEKLGSAAILNSQVTDFETRQHQLQSSQSGLDGEEDNNDSNNHVIDEKLAILKKRQQAGLEIAVQWGRMIVGLSLPMHEEVCVNVLNQLKEFLKSKGKVIGMSGQDIQWIATSCWNQGIYHKQ